MTTSKPILAIFLTDRISDAKRADIKRSTDINLSHDYHILVLGGAEKVDVKVFFEKDQVELDAEKLQQLLDQINK